MTEDTGKEHDLISHHQLEELRKGQKGDTTCRTTSQNPSRWHPSWLSNLCATRRDSESEWLAKDNPEINSVTIKPETASHMAELSSWVPWPSRSPPGALFPMRVFCFVNMCVSSDSSFPVLDKSPFWGPGRGPPSCNTWAFKTILDSGIDLFIQLNITKTNNLIRKWSEDLTGSFSQKIHTDGQQIHEKALNIVNHQENANQNHMRYHLTPVRMAYQKDKK